MTQITSASIHYNEQGTPVSDAFDDVYFSNESGLQETQYVFIDKNQLHERWPLHPRPFFHIIETGFGTGLNFLLAWRNFQAFRQRSPEATCQRLYFSTFEKFPLTLPDLQQALACWPELSEFSAQLLAQYPKPTRGCHRLSFMQDQVVLDLWLGDVHDNLPQLPAENIADAWFLDGFAPSKNPEMWQDSLFTGMARLSRAGTSVATFTSAGIVRRGLQQVGFHVQKVKGYGRKREMAIANMPELSLDMPNQTANQASTDAPVMIVGGGLASCLLALALIDKGRRVHLLCADKAPAQMASHNRQGALYPQLQSSFSLTSRFHLECFGFAHRRYRQLLQNFDFPAEFCGVLQLACNEQLSKRFDKIAADLAFPCELVTPVSATTASDIAGLSLPYAGLYYAEGGWVAPQLFCQAAINWLLSHPHFTATFDCTLKSYAATEGGFALTTSVGLFHAEQLALCTGQYLHQLPQTQQLPLNLIRGQVSHVKAEGLGSLNTVICHQGYITPQVADFAFESCIGATFDRDVPANAHAAVVTTVDDQRNLDLVNNVLANPQWFADATVMSAKAAYRTTAPDHLPLGGALTDGCYLIGGLGARGLLFAPLLAEHVAAELCAEPSPLSVDLQAIVAATRFHSSKPHRGASTDACK